MNTFTLPRIVALAGYAGSGKDTAALALEPLGYRHDSFAAPLKAMALDLNPWIAIRKDDNPAMWATYNRTTGGSCTVGLRYLVERYGWHEAKQFAEVREYLQRLGTDVVRRHLGDDAWIRAMERRVKASKEPTVITDCRFENEAQWALNCGGLVVWVYRPGVGPANSHASENERPKYLAHRILRNDGTPGELHEQLRAIVAAWKLKGGL